MIAMIAMIDDCRLVSAVLQIMAIVLQGVIIRRKIINPGNLGNSGNLFKHNIHVSP
jgi:hypothetical protein